MLRRIQRFIVLTPFLFNIILNFMKHKVFILVLFICVVGAVNVYAFGVGAQVNFRAGRVFAPGASLVISPTDLTHLAVNWYLDFENVNTVGLTLDVCPVTLYITGSGSNSLNFTLGIGLFANMVFDSDYGIDAGLRVPVGLNVLFGRRVFEIYTHIAPSFGVDFLPSLGLSNPFFPIAIGARIWFR